MAKKITKKTSKTASKAAAENSKGAEVQVAAVMKEDLPEKEIPAPESAVTVPEEAVPTASAEAVIQEPASGESLARDAEAPEIAEPSQSEAEHAEIGRAHV